MCAKGKYSDKDGEAQCISCAAWEFNTGANQETGVGPQGCEDCLTPAQMYGLAQPEQCTIVVGALVGAIVLPILLCLLWKTGILGLCCFCCCGHKQASVGETTIHVRSHMKRGKQRRGRGERSAAPAPMAEAKAVASADCVEQLHEQL
jgi:hypothetical protein